MSTPERDPLRASLFTVLEDDQLTDWNYEHLNENLETANIVARTHLDFSLLRRGDIVEFKDIADRGNAGKLIFDGFDLISLDRTHEEQGAVPSVFDILDFPSINYWVESLFDSTTVWVHPNKLNTKDHKFEKVDNSLIEYNEENGSVFALRISGYTIYTSSVENTLNKINGETPLRLECGDTLSLLDIIGNENVLFDVCELSSTFDE